MDAVRSTVKQYLEKHKFFDSLKTAVAKDPKLAKVDRNSVKCRCVGYKGRYGTNWYRNKQTNE